MHFVRQFCSSAVAEQLSWIFLVGRRKTFAGFPYRPHKNFRLFSSSVAEKLSRTSLIVRRKPFADFHDRRHKNFRNLFVVGRRITFANLLGRQQKTLVYFGGRSQKNFRGFSWSVAKTPSRILLIFVLSWHCWFISAAAAPTGAGGRPLQANSLDSYAGDLARALLAQARLIV